MRSSHDSTKKGRGATNTDRPELSSYPTRNSQKRIMNISKPDHKSNLKDNRDHTVVFEVLQLLATNKIAVFGDGDLYWLEPCDMVASVRRFTCRPGSSREWMESSREWTGDIIVPARPHVEEWLVDDAGHEHYRGLIDPGTDPKSVPALGIDESAELIPSPLFGEVSL